MKIYNKISAFMILIVLVSSVYVNGALEEDEGIVSATIANTYIGRVLAKDIITNLNFTDVAKTYWGREAIMRMGALDITKGYVVNGARAFRPTQNLSKQEALAFILRSIGQEDEAKVIAETLPQGAADSTVSLWSKGYLTIANQLGLLTNGELTDALALDQTVLDPTLNFIRTDGTTRELAAKWIVQAINSQNPNIIAPLYRQQSIFNYNDWQSMDIGYIPYIEAVIEAKIMVGDNNKFNPKGILSRVEMMQIMKNMDELLYGTMNLTSKTGYVGHMETSVLSQGDGSTTTNKVWVRVSDGSVDQLVKTSSYDALKRLTTKDVIVYKGNELVTLDKLNEGDTINYIVDELTDEVYYAQVISSDKVYHVSGVLQPLSEIGTGKITIVNTNGQKQTYTMANSLYNNTNGTLIINDMYINQKNAPVTDVVTLSIKNQLITQIRFGGQLTLANEFSGLVIEHNTAFNYIRISDWNGKEVIKRYNEGNITVEKEDYYDNEDQVGYFDELFPYYGFDEDDAVIDDIEVGDIVHVKLDAANLDNIIAISAKTNYTVKFGEVLSSINKGDEGYHLTLKMSDEVIVSYDITEDIRVIEGSKNVTLAQVEAGDLVRILVNQGVVAPGTIQEGVKEIMIDPNGNIVANIYRGELGTINLSQETLSVINSYELLQTGWKNYTTAKTMDISKDKITYYYKDKQITLEYADKFLRQEGMDMYVVTENYFNKERVIQVTFRDGRDSVLAYSNVTITNGLNQLEIQNHDGVINMDLGTIVVKNNKLIAASNVLAPDYTQVVLNGNNQAAILQVKPQPNNDSISVFRGRIAKINEYEDFEVTSHAVLSDMDWIYSPIERVFEIDYKTIIKDEESIVNINAFIGYSDASKVDEVYTIIADGVMATHIIKGPYAKDGVIGEVYELNLEDMTISMKDTITYDKTSKQWNELSRPNSYSQAEVFNESVIIKNNKVIALEQVEVGDTLRIMTTIDLAEQLKLENLREFPGYIVFVE